VIECIIQVMNLMLFSIEQMTEFAESIRSFW
jgi:hypothetical protein